MAKKGNPQSPKRPKGKKEKVSVWAFLAREKSWKPLHRPLGSFIRDTDAAIKGQREPGRLPQAPPGEL